MVGRERVAAEAARAGEAGPLPRRGLIAGAAALAGAALAKLIGAERAEASHSGGNVFHVDEANHSSGITSLKRTNRALAGTTLAVENTNGSAILGTGTGKAGAISAHNDTDQGFGITAKAPLGTGVQGVSDEKTGVAGRSKDGTGVSGTSQNHIGVMGEGPVNGVAGLCDSASGVGVRAVNSGGGFALSVNGRARHSTGGAGTVADGEATHAVADPDVTNKSHITVTLTGDPGNATVQWIELQPGIGFVLHLSQAVAQATSFTYLVAEYFS